LSDPGDTQLARMPCCPTSRASARIMPVNPLLAAELCTLPMPPTSTLLPVSATMLPPPLAIIEAVNALRRNEVLALLGDRDGSYHTIRMDFFGKPTDIPVGAAYLAIASGAPVIPVFVPMENGTYATLMDEAIYFRGGHGQHSEGIRSGMERLLAVFERGIRQYPDQWYNLYDFFGIVQKSDTTKGP